MCFIEFIDRIGEIRAPKISYLNKGENEEVIDDKNVLKEIIEEKPFE